MHILLVLYMPTDSLEKATMLFIGAARLSYNMDLMCLYPQVVRNRSAKRSEKTFVVGCGHCIECLKAYSEQWAVRCMLESREYKDNCFITLTYAPEYLPEGGELCKRDLTLFIKALRERVRPRTFRYFACGEYGSERGRCHFHVLLFGYNPSDLEFLKISKRGVVLYRSRFIEQVWKKGFISISEISYETALYSCKYMQKLNTVPHTVEPYNVMSRRPGIGRAYAERLDGSTDYVYLKGRRVRLPRYFLKVMDEKGIDLSDIRFNRNVDGMIKVTNAPENDLERRRKKAKEIFGKSLDF